MLIIVELSIFPVKLFVKSSDISILPKVSSVYFLESDKNVEMPKESACDVRILSSSVSALDNVGKIYVIKAINNIM